MTSDLTSIKVMIWHVIPEKPNVLHFSMKDNEIPIEFHFSRSNYLEVSKMAG